MTPIVNDIGHPKERLVVVGNGMAGMRAVEELLSRNPNRYRITVIGAEPHTNCNRIMLSSVLAAEKRVNEIVINPRGWYDEQNNRLADFLASVGAVPDMVIPYEYASKAADEAIAGLIEELALGTIDAVAFTSAPQSRRLFEVAQARGQLERLLAGCRGTAIAAIGPIVAEELRRHGLTPSIIPAETYFMKPLVSAIVSAFDRV
jgi:uroporphyrinogen-III synthase